VNDASENDATTNAPTAAAGDPRWAWRVAPLALVVLTIAGVVLVASTVS
jgi:hypothetical protein